MIVPADSSVPTEISSIDHTFVFFPFIFYFSLLMIGIIGSLFRKGIKMKIFLLFTIIYLKINTNVVKTISSRQ